jgi:hypothetical protein
VEKMAIVLPVKKFPVSLPFVELKSVLFCLHEPATGPHPESGESSVHSFALCFHKVHFSSILPSSFTSYMLTYY